MKMVTLGRGALTLLRRHLPLLRVEMASAALVAAAVAGPQDSPIVATRSPETATVETTRAGWLPAAGEANVALPGRSRPGRDGVSLDTVGPPGHVSLRGRVTGLFPLSSSRSGTMAVRN